MSRAEQRIKVDEVRAKRLPCEICGTYDETLDVCEHCLGVYCRHCHSNSPARMKWNPKYQTQVICCPLCGGFLL